MTRIGSEYRDPNQPMDRWEFRLRFLVLLNELRPAVLENLREEVFPAYAAAEANLPAPWPSAEALDEWRKIDPCAYPGMDELGTALLDWAKRYNLTDNWLLRTAFATVRLWYKQQLGGASSIPGAAPVRFLSPDHTGFLPVVWESSGTGSSFPASPFTFEHRPWVPAWMLRTDYEADLREALEQALRAYLEQCETEARDQGLSRTPEMRGRFDRDLTRLIRWQVPPTETYGDVAASEESRVNKGESTDNSAVRKAVQAMARLIGLTPRTQQYSK